MKTSNDTKAVAVQNIKAIGQSVSTYWMAREKVATMRESLTATLKAYFKAGGEEKPLRAAISAAGVDKRRVSDAFRDLGYHGQKKQSPSTDKAKKSNEYDAKVGQLFPELQKLAKSDADAMVAIAFRLYQKAQELKKSAPAKPASKGGKK